VKPETRKILERRPEEFLLRGLDEAPDHVLHDLVVHRDDPENARRQDLVRRAEAQLSQRRDQASIQLLDLTRKTLKRTVWILWLTALAALASVVSVLVSLVK
jgi:hypothetical protein